MIVTFTANPSMDRTSLLAAPLDPLGVNHVISSTTFGGGRGYHLAAAVNRAGREALAVMPALSGGPLEEHLRASGVPHRIVPVSHPARNNVTVSHGGITTLFREPGIPLEPESVSSIVSAVMAQSPGADWLALCGSLPPGAPLDLYRRLCRIAHGVGARVALQTTGPALGVALESDGDCRPDVLSLNARQLGEITGQRLNETTGDSLVEIATGHVQELRALGFQRVLLSLGEVGGIVSGPEGAWYARSEAVPAVTASGRGATALAGYLMARSDGGSDADALTRAMQYGTARAMLPGDATPGPDDADAVAVLTSALPV